MPLYSADQFVAHRGLRNRFPENSLPGVNAAIAAGAVNVEVDVQFSKDGVAMLYHDYELQRLSAVSDTVNCHSAAELMLFKAHEPLRWQQQFEHLHIQPLSALLPIIRANPQVHFYIELKVEAVLDHGLEHCLSHLAGLFQGLMVQLTLISFDPLSVKHAKPDYGFLHSGLVLLEWQGRDQAIRDCDADIAYVDIKRIPAEAAITAACPLVVYEIADVALALAVLQRGAAKIETFSIDTLLQEICLQPA